MASGFTLLLSSAHMSGSRLRRRRKQEFKSKNKWLPKLLLFFVGVILITGGISLIIWNLLPQTWDRESRLVVAIKSNANFAPVVIFDPSAKSVTEIKIPANTQIEAAWQMGAWRVGSLWQLGVQEKLSGELLARSITKSFSFPIDAWSEEGSWESFSPTVQTNLTLKDRINLKLFTMSLKPSSYHTVELEGTNYLKSTILNDGEEGYIINGQILPSIASYFSDNELSQLSPKIAIYDETKRKISAEKVGEVIQVLGGKVYAIYERPESNTNCTVVGEIEKAISRVARVLDCDVLHQKPQSSFDIEIYLGSEFESKF